MYCCLILLALEEEPESDDEEDDVKMVNPLKRPAGGATVKTPQVDWRFLSWKS